MTIIASICVKRHEIVTSEAQSRGVMYVVYFVSAFFRVLYKLYIFMYTDNCEWRSFYSFDETAFV